MKYGFQIIQLYSKQAIPSVVFSFESRRYFFNIPETFQRFSNEHLVRFSKSSKIFFTQVSADHMNGIFGFLLTLYETKSAFDVQLFGPPGFSKYLDSIRYLFGYKILTYSAYDFGNNHEKLLGLKTFKGMEKILGLPDYIRIFPQMNNYLFDFQKQAPNDINDAQSFIKEESYFKDENIEIHPLLLTPDPLSSLTKTTVCYICKPNIIPGKVNPEKVKAFNVPRKFIANIVNKRELVVDGVLYKAADFQEPDVPSPVLILIDCPGVEYIDSLVFQEAVKPYFAENHDGTKYRVKAVIHMAPMEVLLDQRYADFLKKFEGDCQHIFVNEHLKETEITFNDFSKKPEEQQEPQEGDPSAADLEEVDKNTKYRHFLLNNVIARYYPDYFPILDNLPKKQDHDLETLYPFLAKKVTAQKLVEFGLAPATQEGFKKLRPSFSKSIELIKFKENPKFIEKFNKIKELIGGGQNDSMSTNTDVLKLFENCDPEMVFLGTGSMMPSAYRNVSAIYLRFWQQGDVGMLLDCGEGTYFQLLHHYGGDKTRELLKNLNVIFITHIHADHNLGLMSIITEREKILKEENLERDPIFLVIPQNLAPTVFKYEKIEKLRYRIVYNAHINVNMDKLVLNPPKQAKGESERVLFQQKKKNPLDEEEDEFVYTEDPDVGKIGQEGDQVSFENIKLFEEFLLTKLGVKRFRTINVEHCPQACAVLIEHVDGWKFVYSGDTRPTQKLVEGAGPVTILVHESSFTDELINTARKKMHSTEGEAIDIGMKMKAWRTVLTHFSQRYKAHQKAPIGKKKKKDEMSEEPKELQTIEEVIEKEIEEDKTAVKGEDYYYKKQNVIRVCDHFRMKFSDLNHMAAISRTLYHVFPEDSKDT